MCCGRANRVKAPITLCDCVNGDCTTYVMTFDRSGNASLTLEDLVTPYAPSGTQSAGACVEALAHDTIVREDDQGLAPSERGPT